MPHALRILLTGSAFLVFFMTGALIGRLVLPLVAHFPGSPARKKRRLDAFFLFANRWFVGYMRLFGLVRFRRPELPPDFPHGRAYMLIANHPSLIDVLLPLTMIPGLTTLYKPSWYRKWSIRPLLRYGNHVAGTDGRALQSSDAEEDSSTLDRMVAQLRAGHPLLLFPEGTRSRERSLRRFRRGAVEAAVRAGVPIVPMFISVNPPMLMKHQPWHVVPKKGGRYVIEFFPVLETAGKDLDPRAVNRQLHAMYEARHAVMLRERDADALAAASTSSSPTTNAPPALPSAPPNPEP